MSRHTNKWNKTLHATTHVYLDGRIKVAVLIKTLISEAHRIYDFFFLNRNLYYAKFRLIANPFDNHHINNKKTLKTAFVSICNNYNVQILFTFL